MKTDKYKGYTFESSSEKTPAWNAFSRAMKADLVASLPEGYTLAEYTSGHFYFNAFIHKSAKPEVGQIEQFFNVFCSDVRFFPEQWHKALTIRTAKSLKDYAGGRNVQVSLPLTWPTLSKNLPTTRNTRTRLLFWGLK